MPMLAPLIPMVAKLFFSFVASRILNAKSKSHNQEETDPGIQANYQSSKIKLPLLYGQSRVGINKCYINTSGSDAKYLHIIGILGEGPIEGFSDQVRGVDPLYFNNKLYTEFGAGNVEYELFTGTSTQNVCSTLHAAISEWTDPLRYTAYIYVRLKFDRDKFQGVPEITVGIKGLKVTDPNTSTTAYSNNSALCVYDMLTRSAFRGGFGIAASRILTSSVETARAYCADKGWTCNMPVNGDRAITDNLRSVLNNYRGEIIKSAAQFKFAFRDLNEESVVMALDHDNILDGSLEVHSPSAFNNYNAVKINYIEETGDTNGGSSYKDRTFVFTGLDNDFDDGSLNFFEIDCKGLSNLDVVQQMAYYYKERYTLFKDFKLQSGQSAFKLEPMDLITITHTMPGWDTKYARVTSVGLNPDFTTAIACIEENLDFYDDNYDPSLETFYDTTLPDPNTAPINVINASLSEEVYYYRNRSFTRLILDFDPPGADDDPFFEYVEVWMKIGVDDYRYMTRSEGNYIRESVDEGDTYYFKLVSVNIYGVRQADGDGLVLSKTVVGRTDVPSNLSSMTAAANGDSVSIFADPISDPDIEGYEVRLGDAWDGAIFISFNKNCSLRLNGVRPGTHTFWMSPKDNAGNYAATPVSATVKVFIPPGFTQLATYGSWSWDFDGVGTHDNTEHVTYDSSDALKCSHTSDVLTGTYTTPTYDLNAIEDVRIWGDFRMYFSSSATTWNGVAPSGTTWDDLGAALSWMEIFDPEAAGKIQATLKFSEDNSNWTDVDFFEVLCAEVTARYIKLEITITDPTLDANLYLKELNMLAYEGPQ
ncbi:MAG: hypothetical protein DRH26_18910 [Deltaproteobacteria bacterium]|nr:MAG: hypothetical protein DRH26_18910 [Deltaproteobacteria bacterium]